MKLFLAVRLEGLMQPKMYQQYLLTLILCISGFTPLAWAESRFDGVWQINHDETDKVAVKYDEGSGVQGNSGRLKPTIDIGLGLPLPQRIKQPPMSDLSANDPQVLRCTTMTISSSGKRINMEYDQTDKELLVKGDYRGRTTSISKKRIQQKYKTTERKVTKTWSIRDDGRLLVSVKLNPNGDKSRTYNRVFDRQAANTQGG